MPRSGGGVYTLPAGSLVTDGVDDILATQHNTPLQDIATDMNTPRPIVAGGTGAATAADARTNLGATATGSALFTAADAAAGRTAIGAEPIATLAAGPGRVQQISAGTSSNLTLPAGGNWVFDYIVWGAGTGIFVARVVDIAAGGTVLWTTSSSQFVNGFAKRIA